MTFFWQNQAQFRLQPPSEERTHGGNLAARDVMGLVINPRLNEAVLAVTDGSNVGIRSLRQSLRQIGRGYYGEEYDKAATATGFPRSHTPAGVDPKGMGYGTSLYTALCLGAYQDDVGWTHINMGIEGQGISSESEGRSHEATRWWSAATERGLADEEEEETEEEDQDVDLDVSARDLEDCVSVPDDASISYVNSVSVDLVRRELYTVNTYTYDSAENHDLVAVAFSVSVPQTMTDSEQGLRFLWQSLRDDDYDEDEFDADATALQALDVRGMSLEAINLVSVLYAKVGLGSDAIDNMRWRWQYNVDPGVESPQLRMFNPAANQAVLEAREETEWANLATLP